MLGCATYRCDDGAPASGGGGVPIGEVVETDPVKSTVSAFCVGGASFHSRILASASAKFANIS